MGMKGLKTLGIVIGACYLSNLLDPEDVSGSTRLKNLSKSRRKSLSPANHIPVSSPRTVGELKRWGRWASKTFGKKRMPPMMENGTFTAYALSATAWGEDPPRDEKEASDLARRGLKALDLAADMKAQGHGPDDAIPDDMKKSILSSSKKHFHI